MTYMCGFYEDGPSCAGFSWPLRSRAAITALGLRAVHAALKSESVQDLRLRACKQYLPWDLGPDYISRTYC